MEVLGTWDVCTLHHFNQLQGLKMKEDGITQTSIVNRKKSEEIV